MSSTLPRLSDAVLTGLPPAVIGPRYERAGIPWETVHVVLGAFRRAHQAVYTDDRLAEGEAAWGICGLSLHSSAMRQALQPQDGLYTVLERGPEGDRLRVIGAVLEALTVPDMPDAALARLTDPRTRIISLTVTEKGYCRDAATGTLDEAHPDIVQDLRGERFPRSVPGLLVETLRQRREAGAPPCSVLACDNLPSNGAAVACIVRRYAASADLAAYIAGEITFPSTMVDRIVPATQSRVACRHRYGGEAMAEPVLAAFLRRLWDEDLLPTLPPVPGMELGHYTATLEDGSATRQSGTACGRSPWTARRSCRNDCWRRPSTACAREWCRAVSRW